MHPVRQRTHSAGIFGIGLDKVERSLSLQNTAAHGPRPHLDDDQSNGRISKTLYSEFSRDRDRKRLVMKCGATASLM